MLFGLFIQGNDNGLATAILGSLEGADSLVWPSQRIPRGDLAGINGLNLLGRQALNGIALIDEKYNYVPP